MFEGNLQEAGFASAVQTGGPTDGQADGLRPLEWPVLVARLAAARDLRSVFARRKLQGGGNFACFSAAESLGSAAILNKSASGVNRNASADCKDNGAIVPAAALEAGTGDREL